MNGINSKYNITEATVEVLEALPCLKIPLRYDLLNLSALARFIKPAVEKKMKGSSIGIDAITIAIRRYAEAVSKAEAPNNVLDVIKGSRLTFGTDLSMVHLKRTPELYLKLIELSKTVNWYAGERMYIIQRTDDMSVVVTPRFMQLLRTLVSSPQEILGEREDLAIITAYTPPKSLETPGVIAYFANLLAETGVNILLTFSTFYTISFVIEAEDAGRAYEKLSIAIKNVQAVSTDSTETVP
ncbi:ACT domain-containing protein [Candidatus Micrarchaeota archaeon]|nr:ACT domain-containing protein [Candidatus Micrarchaeota archaeon]